MNDDFEILIKDTMKKKVVSTPGLEDNWAAIGAKIRKQKMKRRFFLSGMAALLMLFAGLTGLLFVQENNGDVDYYAQTAFEWNETNYYYTVLFDEEFRQIVEIENLDKEYFQLFFDELGQLDQEYKIYLDESKTYGFQEGIIRAMVENQRRKLQILKRLENEIQKVQTYENRKITM